MSDLGTARGRIVIDVSDVRRAQAEVQQSSQRISRALGFVGQATGLTFGAAAIAQIGRYALEASKVAVAYERQTVAALTLAGSQSKLNDLLAAYEKATGGAIDKAQALADVTRLQAIGFADSAAELNEFARAARGISVATGQSQDYVISQLQLAIANQSTLRLDQLGLGVAEVKERIDELKDANRGLTDEMAYQQAILGLADQKFGSLVDSAAGQAQGLELLATAWKNLRLEIGDTLQGPLNTAGTRLAERFDATVEAIEIERQRQAKNRTGLIPGGLTIETNIAGARATLVQLQQGLARVMEDIETGARPASETGPLLIELNEKIRAASITIAGLSAQRLLASGDLPQGAPSGITGGSAGAVAAAASFTKEQINAAADHARAVRDIERQANLDRLEATRQFEEQRASIIRQYGLAVAREAADFATSRRRQEEDFNKSILDIRRDSTRRELRAIQDFQRDITRAQEDSSERIAELREDSNKRLAEIDEDFKRDQERREQDFRDDQLSAAGRLDAIALLELRKDRARQLQDARRANEEQKSDLKEQLEERIQDEQEALDERTRQAKEAFDRQLADARQADEERIADAKADQELRQRREDEDRAIRLQRMAEDHRLQLDELARQNALRMAQIDAQEALELASEQEAFGDRLAELLIFTDAWLARQRRWQAEGLRLLDDYLDAQRQLFAGAVQGPAARPINPGPPSILNPPIFPGGASTSRITNNINAIISIGNTGGRSDEYIIDLVEGGIVRALEKVAGG